MLVRTSRTPTIQSDRPSPSAVGGLAPPTNAPRQRSTGGPTARTRRLLVLLVVAAVLALVPLPASIAGPASRSRASPSATRPGRSCKS